jgi:hypothetical protein
VIFTMQYDISQLSLSFAGFKEAAKILKLITPVQSSNFPLAQLSLHTPVNQLHSIEIQALINSFFLLT